MMPIDAHEEGSLPLGVALLDDVVHAGHGRRVGTWTDEPLVRSHDVLDVPGKLDTSSHRMIR